MDIIDYLLYMSTKSDFLLNLIIIFGHEAVQIAVNQRIITITESTEPHQAIATLTMH